LCDTADVRGSIVQVNVSRGGVPKRPLPEAWIRADGLDGDSWNYARHGTPDQKVLIVTTEAIAEMVALGYPLFAGALGENLTVDGIDRRHLRTGQRLVAGDAVIQLTRLRTPCDTLNVYGRGVQKHLMDKAARAGDPNSPTWARGGFYARVLREGIVRTGDIIALDDAAGPPPNAVCA
jgi:MOSC domain-containing protein YiiM